MDWLIGIAAVATIIAAIIAIITFFERFWRSKKKSQEPVSITNSPGATVVEKSQKTTVTKDSPGTTIIEGDVNIFYPDGHIEKKSQHPSRERVAQTLESTVREVSGQMSEDPEHLRATHLSAAIDSTLQQAHTEKAVQELNKVFVLRVIDSIRSRRDIQQLQNRVEHGDLAGANSSTKNRVRYWTARLCASDNETLELAKQLRKELRQSDLDEELSVVDALIAEADGDSDKALRILRDHDAPDPRSVLFSLLVRLQGERAALDWVEQQDGRSDPRFFTAAGWRNWAVRMAKIGKWEEAAKHLLSFESHWQNMPALAFVEGVINAAILLPNDLRERALENVPTYQGVTPNLVPEAESHHSRAAICFEFAEQSLEDIADHDLTRFISDWRLWTRLMDPDTANANAVRNEIRRGMEEGSRAVELIHFAYAFNISFNVEPLRQYLGQRKRLGGLNDRELLAECLLLFRQSIKPRDLVTYLEQNKTRLTQVMPLALVTTMHVDALVRDGQTERARALVTEHASDLGEAHSNRLTVMIDAHEGTDPRKKLELLYQQTGSLVDLRNLVSYLKNVDDRAALRPLVRDLFDRERTIENALDLVKCFGDPSCFDYQTIIEFLENNPDILERNDDLKGAKAWALFQAARLQDAREINDILVSQRATHDDLRLEINIAISSGHWERVPAILDREWPRRDSLDPETLMGLAQLAGQNAQTSDRAIQLSKLAAQKAPDDPRILAAAVGLHFQLGRDDEADPSWLARATELSSADKGPLWPVDFQELVTGWIPKRRDYLREVERKWLSGEIPIGLAADRFNKSLATLLLHIPKQNTTEMDGRRRMILPIIAGGREPAELQEDWTIGLDVTSILVLSHLDLLETAIDAFHHVKLAPDVMEFLFREKSEVRFHQPSRIRAAKQVQQLQSKGQLRVADKLAVPPNALTEEVGLGLAELLQTARHENGKVICALPIHRVGSLMEQTADTSEYDGLILSTMDICTLLHDEGKIDEETYQRASLFLRSQNQLQHANPPSSVLNAPIYVDGLALSYLQDARILQALVGAGLDVRVHQSVLDEMHAFIGAGDVGNDLVENIERIRHVLRNALDSGSASFVPRTTDQKKRVQNDAIRFQVTASLVASSADYNALCIEDRYINSHPVLNEPTGRPLPVVCVMDVLRYLISRNRIDVINYWSARHKIRESGFSFVRLDSDELTHWLKAARVDNNQLMESAELRIIRQTLAHIDSIDLANPSEMLALSSDVHKTCRETVANLWEDSSLTTERAAVLSSWAWRNLIVTATWPHKHTEQSNIKDLIKESISLRLGYLLLPTAIQSQDRHVHYTHWIERNMLGPLRPANAEVIEKALSVACEAISNLEDNQKMYGTLFFEQLPAAVRRLVITNEEKFASQFGLETRRVFTIEPGIKLVDSDLFAAAKETLAINKKRTVQDITGKTVLVDFDGKSKSIVVKWSDANGALQQVQMPHLTLLSPDRTLRVSTLGNIIDYLGPAATDFNHLIKDINSRELSLQEISTIFDETSNGVATLQGSLIQKIKHGSGINVVDIVPQSISYFERFCGPAPDSREPESYFKEVLIPHRKALLSRSLEAGLDICCLGALRDDLTPGQWVDTIDDDAIWNALSLCRAETNPFSLLAALDIALYRQRDPRFQEFSAKAVAKLLDEQLVQQDGADLYRLLTIVTDLVLNRVNLLQTGPLYPGYWKRMCAWMQAGLVARALADSSSPIDLDALEQWAHSNMVVSGEYAGLVDAREEPMLSAGRLSPEALRDEILGRLQILKSRHENEGRQVPRSADIDQALDQSKDSDQTPFFAHFPGPLEGHRRPTQHVPQGTIEKIEDTWKDSTLSLSLQRLVLTSHLFALRKAELERVLQAINSIEENDSSVKPYENLILLEWASVIAAANRDTMLADGIADAVVRVVPGISEQKEIYIILRIMLQAATAYEAHDEWFKWLEERLARIALHLPPPPNKCLRIFLDHLESMGTVLPIDSWFHIRAQSIASSGAA